MALSLPTVSVINKSIHVVALEDKFSVHVYVNGKLDAQYGTGPKEWAEHLANMLAAGDCPRCSANDTHAGRYAGSLNSNS